jgi:hypothetical protein
MNDVVKSMGIGHHAHSENAMYSLKSLLLHMVIANEQHCMETLVVHQQHYKYHEGRCINDCIISKQLLKQKGLRNFGAHCIHTGYRGRDFCAWLYSFAQIACRVLCMDACCVHPSVITGKRQRWKGNK